MSTEAEPWTILRLLEWTTKYFHDNGSCSPRLDAELLLAEARNCERIDLYTAFNEQPDQKVRDAFRELVKRRGEGTPVAHLLGKKEFYSLSFRVTEDTLIPRPETEHLVIEVLDEVKRQGKQNAPLRIADIGTGSGIIAICLAKNLPAAKIDAVDVSPQALEIASFNARAHEVEAQIEFNQSDLMSNLDACDYDFVCSNPPYVSEAEYQELDRTVRDFEPKSALVSGPTGAEIIERLANDALPRLKGSGRLVFEISPMIHDRVLSFLDDCHPPLEVRVIRDLDGHHRIVSVGKRE